MDGYFGLELLQSSADASRGYKRDEGSNAWIRQGVRLQHNRAGPCGKFGQKKGDSGQDTKELAETGSGFDMGRCR